MTFQQVVHFHELIIDAYAQLEYELIEVPFGDVNERAKFICSNLNI